jgi:hypothetical protein
MESEWGSSKIMGDLVVGREDVEDDILSHLYMNEQIMYWGVTYSS